MKLIKQSVELLSTNDYTINDIYKQIEIAGRTCYKSEDKITDDSAKKFVDMIIENGHYAMLEHGTVYLKIFTKEKKSTYNRYYNQKYSICCIKTDNYAYITTNYRVLVENDWLEDLKYLCTPTEFHEKRLTFKIITDRGITHELVRHRIFSFAQESTRYCNYSKDKFDNQLTFIIPNWINLPEITVDIEYLKNISDLDNHYVRWILSLYKAEDDYFYLLNIDKWKPQQARAILPNSLKSEIIMTGFESDWKNKFLPLRLSTKAHPQMQEIAKLIKEKINT